MAEEDVGYSSVTFKNKKQTHPEAPTPRQEKTLYEEVNVHKEATKDTNTSASKQEPAVYDEVKAHHQTSQQTIDTTVLFPDKEAERRLRCYQRLTWSFVLLCIILLLAVVGVCVYCVNQMQTLTVSENKITKLTEENQELQTEKKMEATWNNLNVSQAQWSIDAYCPKKNNVRTCTSCQEGWGVYQSSCYLYNDAAPANQRTWHEAQDDCREKASDLTVVADQNEKNHVTSISPAGTEIKGYWIGLRAVEKNWKWIDGTNLTDQTWISPPEDNGQCVISLENQKWKSVSCGDKNAWICEKKALSV